MGIFIQFRANSFNKGKMIEQFVYMIVVGGEIKPKEAYKTTWVGEFIGPHLNTLNQNSTLSISKKTKCLQFQSRNHLIFQRQKLCNNDYFKNNTSLSWNTEVLKLPLAIKKLSTSTSTLEWGRIECRVWMKASFKLPTKGTQKDFVKLFSEVCNSKFNISPPSINFGWILNDITKKRYITMTNISEMVCSYDWSFLEKNLL